MAENNFPILTMLIRTAQQATHVLVSAGHSQAAIAKRAGVSQATISRILSGELKDPAGSTLIKLNEFAEQVETAPKPEPQPQ
jgi:transcriptional regulator with XRE-family HTH domain